MTVYPGSIDSDENIQRIDENLTEIGGEVINQLRAAVFAIESELGITPSGTLSSVSDRLNISLNPNGTIKSSALTSVGLVTLPIDNAQVGSGAGILESKLALDHSTADLNALIQSNIGTINTLSSFTSTTNSDLLTHISGGSVLSDGSTAGRHVASQIDLNAVPSDSRDPSFIWQGLLDKDDNTRSASTVVEALLEINDAFVEHELNTDGDAHFASGVSVNTDTFTTISKSADNVQKAIDAIDQADTLVIQQHQENLHTNGVPRESRSHLIGNVDGYSQEIVPPTPASAFLLRPPATSPVDNNTTGDDIISFNPSNTGFSFDAKFAQVQVGDVVRVNYGSGVEGVFNVESKRHIPGSDWIIRLNGSNLENADGYSALVRIDKKRFDTEKYGTLALAAANNDIDSSIRGSVIIGNPRGAQALGIAFDPTQLDSTHYNLYLHLYPTGDPNDAVVQMPVIDVTGDQGVSPGKYTLSSIVQTVNNAFRAAGFNYRFIAFEQEGEFGIMLADSVSNASFSIVNGVVSSGSLTTGTYTNNVVGDSTDGRDALGFGVNKAALASPEFTSSYSSGLAASSFPTIVLSPHEKRTFVANGLSKDTFAPTYLAPNGYWDGYISARTAVGSTTVEITYQVNEDLSRAELSPGKTIVVQPAIERSSGLFNDLDYGRFIIKEVSITDCCGTSPGQTSITVVNGLHATGVPIGSTAVPDLPVKLYFSEDSVSFNQSNVVDAINGNDYSRHHEIFITDNGKTFSHERARMPVQNETTDLLKTTDGFRINEVSPKLKGYLDDGSSDTNRFVRFYVLNYDSTSGEFDGYIGRRDPSNENINDFGRVVTARKNVPTRFYDASDVDYVEIEYIEEDQYPGTDILSSASSRYVDIEIFDTLATNQEYFRLGGCVLKDNRVEFVKDLREFGNVSEIDFTDSAIRFIESGDRLLHSNGVFHGFTFKGEDISVPGKLRFNGGMALVNGHIATLSEQSISIPEIVRDTGSSETATLEWAICVNDKDLLEAIPVTTNKEHFFARRLADTDNYYIPSVTFSELTTDRKDLTLIMMVNVTIASTTVNSVRDARKLVVSNDSNAPLSLYGRDDITGQSGLNKVLGNFNSFEQVKEWVNGFGANGGLYIKVKGNLVIDSEIDLTDLTSPVTFDGIEGNLIRVTSDIGIKVRNNVKFRNLNFQYDASFSGLTAGHIAHLDQHDACILIDAQNNNADSVEISDCTFTRTQSGERAPYIMADIDDSVTVSNIKVLRNKFNTAASGDDDLNTAIAFFHSGTVGGVTVDGAIFAKSIIEDNVIEGKNSILITTDDPSIGMVANSIYVNRNIVPAGVIGYQVVSRESDGYVGLDTGLYITNNKAKIIGTFGFDGLYNPSANTTRGSGYVKIQDNVCERIHPIVIDSPSNNTQVQAMEVRNNTLIKAEAFSSTSSWSLTQDYAVFMDGLTRNDPATEITGNIIYSQNNSIAYEVGVYLSSILGSIKDNNINAFTTYGIRVSSGVSSGENFVISGNKISRNGIDIKANSGYYISTPSAAPSDTVIVDNELDSTTRDGASDEDTISASAGAYVERNKNHIITKRFSLGTYGSPSVGTYNNSRDHFRASPSGNVIAIFSFQNSDLYYTYSSGGSSPASYAMPLISILPGGVKILSLDVNVSVDNVTDWSTASITPYIFKSNSNSPTDTGSVVDLTASASGTLSLPDSLVTWYSNIDDMFVLSISANNSSGFNKNIRFEEAVIKYVW